MNIKGTAVKATKKYIQSNFEDKYDTWLEKLPEETKNFYTDTILANKFYPLMESIIIPTQIAGELFFDGKIKKASFEMGRYSAHDNLKGIYKSFVSIASISFLVKIAKKITSAYYDNAEFNIIKNTKKELIYELGGFAEEESLLFDRNEGWTYGIFDVINKYVNTVTHIIEPIENSKLVKSLITVKF